MKMVNFYLFIVISGLLLMDIKWIELIEFIKSLVIIFGGVIGLYTYLNQQNQRRIDNSFKTLEYFAKNISKTDIGTWEEIVSKSYEGTGAKPGYFIVFGKEKKRKQVPLSTLFYTEGKRLIIYDSSQENSILYVDAIRRITEQLNIIGYQYISKNIDFKIIYFELGQLIDIIYAWIDTINDPEHKNFVTEEWFPDFIKMYNNTVKQREKLPKKTFTSNC